MQYSRLGSKAGVLSHIIPDRQEREFTIEDLEEWTEYEVKVQSFNGIGPGPWSQPVHGRTRESGEKSAVLSFLPLLYFVKTFLNAFATLLTFELIMMAAHKNTLLLKGCTFIAHLNGICSYDSTDFVSPKIA